MSRRRLLVAGWSVLVTAVIVLSVLPGSVAPREPAGGDIEHCLAYVPLGLLPVLVLPSRRAGWWAAAAMVAMGVVLELVQTQIPGRGFEWSDMSANALGVALGGGVGMLRRGRGTD